MLILLICSTAMKLILQLIIKLFLVILLYSYSRKPPLSFLDFLKTKQLILYKITTVVNCSIYYFNCKSRRLNLLISLTSPTVKCWKFSKLNIPTVYKNPTTDYNIV